MKKIIYSISSLVIVAAMASCEKKVEHASKQIVIDTTLASGTEYILDLKPYGDADDVAVITKQATSFTISEIKNQAGTFAPVYHYSATSKTGATDQVVLSVTEGNRENEDKGHREDSTNITINFIIK